MGIADKWREFRAELPIPPRLRWGKRPDPEGPGPAEPGKHGVPRDRHLHPGDYIGPDGVEYRCFRTSFPMELPDVNGIDVVVGPGDWVVESRYGGMVGVWNEQFQAQFKPKGESHV